MEVPILTTQLQPTDLLQDQHQSHAFVVFSDYYHFQHGLCHQTVHQPIKAMIV